MLEQYKRQQGFTDVFLAHMKKKHPEMGKVELTKELLLALHNEVSECLSELPWKTHKNYDASDIDGIVVSNVGEEGIDMLKLVFEILQIWGFSYAQVIEEFDVKSDVVEDRWRQEHDLTWTLGVKPLVLVDLDGVLNHYPQPFLDFVAQKAGPRYATMEELESDDMELKLRMKDLYRQSGIKRHLPVKDDSVFGVRSLVSAGYDVLIMSQRPAERYARIEGDTMYWLRRNGIPYRRLIFTDSKQRRLLVKGKLRDRIQFAVDDDIDVVESLRDLGIKTYWLKPEGEVKSMLDIPEVRAAIGVAASSVR